MLPQYKPGLFFYIYSVNRESKFTPLKYIKKTNQNYYTPNMVHNTKNTGLNVINESVVILMFKISI